MNQGIYFEESDKALITSLAKVCGCGVTISTEMTHISNVFLTTKTNVQVLKGQ
jgi:hypothetical protein